MVLEIIGLNDLTQIDRADQFVGHLNTHHGNLIGNRCNSNAGGPQAQGNVVGKTGELCKLYALLQFDLVARNGGTASIIDDMCVNGKLLSVSFNRRELSISSSAPSTAPVVP